MSRAIGIDLGTTFTCAAFMKNGHSVEVAANLHGNKITPSVVHYGHGETKVGEDAVTMRGKDPKNTIYQVKRFMGLEADDVEIKKRKYPFEIIASNKGNANIRVTPNRSQPKIFSPEQISNEIIRYAKAIAEDSLGQKVTEAVITVPANFNNAQRQATRDAGEMAGLKVLRVVNEPTAAALAYGFEKHLKSQTRVVLVYDLGGGTFDVSIVKMRGTEAEVNSTQGLTFLGGEDFNYRLYEEAASEFKHAGDEIPKGEEFALYQSCEQAKKTLSSCTSAEIEMFNSRGQRKVVTITRETFNDLCEDLFQRTIDCVKEAIRDSDYEIDKIDDIVLVGGSSRIPRVQDLLQRLFVGKKLKFDIPPDFAVAYGAAILADSLSQTGGSIMKASGGGAVKLADITAFTLGIGIIYDRVRIVIPRKTKYPTSGTTVLRNMYDNQIKIVFPIVEGESAFESKNKLHGTLFIGIPPKIAGTHFVNITFIINVDGILTVQVTDKETGEEAEMIFEPSMMTTSERNAMMRNKKNRDEEDMIQKAKAEALTAFADAVLDAKQMVHRVSDRNKMAVRNIVYREENWIKNEYPSDSDLYGHAQAVRDEVHRLS